MVLTTIFVVRHGFRPFFHVNPVSGEITSSVPSPTGRPGDVALTAHGVQQASKLGELANTLEPRVSRIYTSPYYRCVQTIQPFAARLPDVPVICDEGLGDWYGKAHFKQPSPAPFQELNALFPFLTAESTSTVPDPNGESIPALHQRMAFALSKVIVDADAALQSTLPESIIISCHAAPIIAIGRVLTGLMPRDHTQKDFNTFTCSVSRFRRNLEKSSTTIQHDEEGAVASHQDWRAGVEVVGGWTCELNASVDHLPNGGERNWHFSDDESFINAIESHNDAPSKPGRLPTSVAGKAQL